MPKRPLKITFRLPPYEYPRNAWRTKIHAEANKAAGSVTYSTADKLEVHIRLYLTSKALTSHDVDNRVKDILDALQGRAGGPKGVRRLRPIVPNDYQVFRLSVEKSVSPKQGRGRGHVVVRRFRSKL